MERRFINYSHLTLYCFKRLMKDVTSAALYDYERYEYCSLRSS